MVLMSAMYAVWSVVMALVTRSCMCLTPQVVKAPLVTSDLPNAFSGKALVVELNWHLVPLRVVEGPLDLASPNELQYHTRSDLHAS